MSTTTRSGSKLSSRIGTALAATGLLLGTSAVALTVAAAPAQASCAYSYLDAGTAYSYAYAETADCSYSSYSYVEHGSLSAYSGWWSVESYAYADAGTSSHYYAENGFG